MFFVVKGCRLALHALASVIEAMWISGISVPTVIVTAEHVRENESVPADKKPRKRTKNPDLLRKMHRVRYGRPCDACKHKPGTQIHHIKRRSQGGDDVPENLAWLCTFCHAALHGNPYIDFDDERWDAERVRAAIFKQH